LVGNGANVTRLLPQGIASLGAADPADVPAALPSSADVLTLQALEPVPTAAVVRCLADGALPAAIVSPPLLCAVAVDAAFSASHFAAGAGNAASGLEFAPAPRASVAGTAGVTFSAGRAAFTFVGLYGAGFGGVAPLAA